MYGHHGLSELDNKRLLRLLKAAASRVRDIKEEKYAMTYRSIETISWPKQYVPFCNWFLLPCNTTTCTAKCISLNYTIYIYSHDDMRRAARRNLSDEILRFGGAGTSQVVNELRRSNRVTQNASDACYFIAENKGRHIYKLQDLPYWNLGINHMVLDFLDGKCEGQHDVGFAALLKTHLSSDIFRSNFDKSLPLPPRQHFRILEHPKKFLITFKGTSYPLHTAGGIRSILNNFHNGKDIIFVTKPQFSVPTPEYDLWSYEELVEQSKFCLVPQGRSPSTFRLLEVMSAGCIPVFLFDTTAAKYIMPISDEIAWEQISFIAPNYPAEFQAFLEGLRLVNNKKVENMSNLVVKVRFN
ncbi:glucuronyl/N-acetylglucosaminyl transferase EXT1 [Galdieria sulphuraria]|uniref:Glucuronyl/N-acetylglucosaminyl transferase EXT1 n=1 Tax=Galdieria sulphuraria TaxID=130081 RepID=M2Y8D0_GALSU|nr:glucuronyl/N-acetylglucosaminyl transferase EXT1 [Galdieria sulphuraria]EME32318.1 glucuronyl/N-acetylglucosaminyl transferase EXT1 [Galdieria sulphuraria]|eukprot:XP_005708838.1 glucuronyl/N-acetylglucosaminyl transferase EXT1 [Galdieria sulphuraria]